MNQITKYLLGGGLIGGGGMAAIELYNYMNELKRKGKKKDPKTYDDDMYYINQKKAEFNHGIEGGLSIAGGTLTALGAAALVRRVSQKWKKKRLVDELQKAQNGYFDTLTGSKEASATTGFIDGLGKATGYVSTGVVASSLLAAVASAVIAKKTLDKQFPIAKKPNKDRPRKVVIRQAGDELQPGEGQMIKTQSEADEHLLCSVLGNNKLATVSGLYDLVHVVGTGRADEVRTAINKGGLDLALEMTKGASADNQLDAIKEALAIGCIVRDPIMGPSVKAAAAVEFLGALPFVGVLAAGVIEQDEEDTYIKMAAELRSSVRKVSVQDLLKHVSPEEQKSNPEEDVSFEDLDDAIKMDNLTFESGESSEEGPAKKDMKSKDEIDDILK